MVDCRRDGLIHRTRVERGFWLLSAFLSVAVHVVRAQMVVVDADSLPAAIFEDHEDNRIALNRPSGLAKSNEHPVDDPDIYCPLIGHGGAASHPRRTEALMPRELRA